LSALVRAPDAMYLAGMHEGLREADEAVDISEARPLVAPEPGRWLSDGQQLVVRCALVLGVTAMALWLLRAALEPAPWW